MADITPIASLNGEIAMPEKVWMQGPPGAAATVTVGTVTTGEPGTDAIVTNSGTESAAVLNFTIPRGGTGPAGADGKDGAAATVTVGTVTTGEPGTDAIVTNSGTENAAVLNFTIPRGETGAVGASGADGVSPTVSTSKSGNVTTITIVDAAGTKTATINDGAKGDTGPAGPAGAGVPDGGTVGQLLGKTESGTAWIDPPQSGGAEPETITWDGETSGLVSADINGHLYYKVSDSVPKIKDLIGGTVSCSDGGKKVIAADDVEYTFDYDDGFSVYASNIDLTFFVVYKDNAVIDSYDFPQKGVYFEKGTAFVSALSFTVTNDSNVTVEINVTEGGEAGALTATVVTPMCLIKEAAGRGFFINATMQMFGINLLSFSASALAHGEFNALFAFYPGDGLSISVYAVKCSYNGACSISSYTLTMTATG